MPKNTIVWKNTRPWSNKKTWRDYSYQKEYNAKPAQKKKRAELNKINREKWTYWNKDNKDVSHKKDWGTFLEKASLNRKRNGMRKWVSVKARRVWTKK